MECYRVPELISLTLVLSSKRNENDSIDTTLPVSVTGIAWWSFLCQTEDYTSSLPFIIVQVPFYYCRQKGAYSRWDSRSLLLYNGRNEIKPCLEWVIYLWLELIFNLPRGGQSWNNTEPVVNVFKSLDLQTWFPVRHRN